MEQNNINIAAILKGMPKGTKLYSPMCGLCFLDKAETCEDPTQATVEVFDAYNARYAFDNFGKYTDEGEVMLFPSKEMRDWQKFAEQMKPRFELGKLYFFTEEDEDGVLNIIGELIGKNEGEDTLTFGNQLEIDVENFVTDQAFDLRISAHKELREATEEECQHFKNAKERWKNSFKAHKFKTFEKVLARDSSKEKWLPALYLKKNAEGDDVVFYLTDDGKCSCLNCIPYEKHGHLAFTTDPEDTLPF